MIDKQTYAEDLILRYTELLNLFHWDIQVLIQDDTQYKKKHGKRFGSITNGCTDIFQNKKKARIYLKDNLDDETFKNCLIHEMVHIPINELYVTGIMLIKELPKSDLKTQATTNWEWFLESAVCRITSALEKLEEEVLDAKMSEVSNDTSSTL